ncbi:MAG: ATP/GTP-binding protein [Zestosphaera sp.]
MITVYFVVVAGPAGSGKSTFISAMSQWMEGSGLDVVKVNLDPAAEVLPYVPDVDVRNYITARDFMVKYGLGPNGALVLSVDYLINYVGDLRREIDEAGGNYALIDLPGQLEVVAFRRLGPIVLKELAKGCKSVVAFMIDSHFASSPHSSYSALLLALSTMYRLNLPMVLILSKADLIASPQTSGESSEMRVKPFMLQLLSEYYSCVASGNDVFFLSPEVNEELCNVFREVFREVVLVSSKELWGVDEAYASFQRVLAGGEDFLTEEYSGGPQRSD